MFFIKFFYFIKGYVIIEVTGDTGTKFISDCAKSGIKLIRVTKKEKLRIYIKTEDFFKVRQIAKTSKTKIKIVKKIGFMFFLKKGKKRLFAFSCLIIFAILFFSASKFIWSVEIVGNERISATEISDTLKEIGLRRGAYKKKLPDVYEMKDYLLSKLDNVSWAFVYIKGTKATVSIHEGVVPFMVVDDSKPCDIVARCDGFLVEVNAKKGYKVINAGNAVNSGEVIISSTVPFKNDEGYIKVHSDGFVYALTHHEKSGDYKLTRESVSYSGKKKKYYNINIFGKSYTFPKIKEFDDYIDNKSTYYLPFISKKIGFSFTSTTRLEVTRVVLGVPYESAVEFAVRDLESKISNDLFSGARLQNKSVEDCMLDNSTVRVTVKTDFIEQIGISVPVSEN